MKITPPISTFNNEKVITTRKEKLKKRIRNVVIANMVFSSLMLLMFIVCLPIIFHYPLPEEPEIALMNDQMIAAGEANFIIATETSIAMFLFFFITAVCLSITSVSYYFLKRNAFYAQHIQNSSKGWTVLFMIWVTLYLFIPFLFVWFFFLIEKRVQKVQVNQVQFVYNFNVKEPIQNAKPLKKRLLYIFLPLLALSAIVGSVLGYSLPTYLSVPNRHKVLEQMYTLSENHPNTITLYFDRSMGLLWNELLTADYIMFHKKNESFIQEFPQFTSFTNTLSQANLTNLSNPMINGSWYQQPEFKNLSLNSAMYGENNHSIIMNNWFLDSYKSAFGLFHHYGYTNIALMNPPYYGEKTFQTNADAQSLENDLMYAWNKKTFLPLNNTSDYQNNHLRIHVMDETTAMKSYGQSVDHSALDDIRLLQYFAANKTNVPVDYTNPLNNDEYSYGSNDFISINGKPLNTNLRVSKSQGSSYLFCQFYTTHQNYSWIKNQDLVSKENPAGVNYNNPSLGTPHQTDDLTNNFVFSMWYAIQKLKQILNYLKKLPCHDPKRPWVHNQYQNSNIYIISDHGTYLTSKFKGSYTEVEALMNYLVNNGYMTKKQKEWEWKWLLDGSKEPGWWNCIYMRKPALYGHKDWNVVHQYPETTQYPNGDISSFFNQTNLYVDSDFMPIVEADIQKQQYDVSHINQNVLFKFNDKESWYANPLTGKIRSFNTTNPSIAKLVDNDFKKNFVLNPLLSNKDLIDKRNIPMYAGQWYFFPKAYNYVIFYKQYFVPHYPFGIFNTKNFMNVTNYYNAHNMQDCYLYHKDMYTIK